MALAYSRSVLRVSAAQLCEQVGWHKSHDSSLQTLTDILERFLVRLGHLAKELAELDGRPLCNLDDVLAAAEWAGVDFAELADYMHHVEPLPPACPNLVYPVQQTPAVAPPPPLPSERPSEAPDSSPEEAVSEIEPPAAAISSSPEQPMPRSVRRESWRVPRPLGSTPRPRGVVPQARLPPTSLRLTVKDYSRTVVEEVQPPPPSMSLADPPLVSSTTPPPRHPTVSPLRIRTSPYTRRPSNSTLLSESNAQVFVGSDVESVYSELVSPASPSRQRNFSGDGGVRTPPTASAGTRSSPDSTPPFSSRLRYTYDEDDDEDEKDDGFTDSGEFAAEKPVDHADDVQLSSQKSPFEPSPPPALPPLSISLSQKAANRIKRQLQKKYRKKREKKSEGKAEKESKTAAPKKRPYVKKSMTQRFAVKVRRLSADGTPIKRHRHRPKHQKALTNETGRQQQVSPLLVRVPKPKVETEHIEVKANFSAAELELFTADAAATPSAAAAAASATPPVADTTDPIPRLAPLSVSQDFEHVEKKEKKAKKQPQLKIKFSNLLKPKSAKRARPAETASPPLPPPAAPPPAPSPSKAGLSVEGMDVAPTPAVVVTACSPVDLSSSPSPSPSPPPVAGSSEPNANSFRDEGTPSVIPRMKITKRGASFIASGSPQSTHASLRPELPKLVIRAPLLPQQQPPSPAHSEPTPPATQQVAVVASSPEPFPLSPASPATSLLTPAVFIEPAEEYVDEYDEEGSGKVWICPVCFQPYNKGAENMVGCDGCDEWFHWHCVGLSAEPTDDTWFCPRCVEKQRAGGVKAAAGSKVSSAKRRRSSGVSVPRRKKRKK